MIRENIFALDLGTTKFCIGALLFDKGSRKAKIDTVSVPSSGMYRGMLANLDKAEISINRLLDFAEKQFQCDIKKVVIGVAGSHLKGRHLLSSIELATSEVTPHSMQTLLKLAEEKAALPKREILHIIPVGYRVDNRQMVDNPVGFSGMTLSGEFHVIDADQPYLKDLIKIVNRCGIEVSRLYSEPFASASVTVEDLQKKAGVAIADIGGGTTDGIVFQNGKPVAIFTVNVAGIMMTNDVAVGLNLTKEEAERVKRCFGLSASSRDTRLEVTDLYNKPKAVTAKDVLPVLGPRLIELASLLAGELKDYKGRLGAGLLLTGGGAEVTNINAFLSQQFKIPVNKSVPILADCPFIADGQDARFSPKYATVIGLINLEIGRLISEIKNKKRSWSKHYISQFVNWVKELS